MIEKFSDYESAGFLSEEGEFIFEVKEAEIKDSKQGNPMVVIKVSSKQGDSTLWHSLNPKARWSYNNLIKACLKLDTPEKIEAFECDYETIHNDLIGKKFKGTVTRDTYVKETKVLQEDGTFADGHETKESFKITKYDFC